MNIKNILLIIGLFCVGLILYKLLFGFLLPVAMFIFLVYILKNLLKNTYSANSIDNNQSILDSKNDSIQINQISGNKLENEFTPLKAKKTKNNIGSIEEEKSIKIIYEKKEATD